MITTRHARNSPAAIQKGCRVADCHIRAILGAEKVDVATRSNTEHRQSCGQHSWKCEALFLVQRQTDALLCLNSTAACVITRAGQSNDNSVGIETNSPRRK